MNRRKLLASVCALAALALARPARAAHTGVSVGAIRWDAWYQPTDTGARQAVETALGPVAYQGRAPVCATIVDTKTVNMGGCSTQAQIDAEITAASAAHLDYWAYCWYGVANPFSAAWLLHQSSSIKAQVKWCMLYTSYTLFGSEVASTPLLSALVGYLAQSEYQRVTVASVSRPLMYLLGDGTSNATLAASITAFRAACTAASLPSPYIVLLNQSSPAAGVVAATGADAVGFYSFAPGTIAGTYASLVSAVEAEWTTLAAGGQAMVPPVMSGWDARPRYEHPPASLAGAISPFVGWMNYFAAGTPAQIAAHIGDVVTWLRANTTAAPAQTALIYSWNEHDEGGSTLNPSLGGGSAILTAVGGAL